MDWDALKWQWQTAVALVTTLPLLVAIMAVVTWPLLRCATAVRSPFQFRLGDVAVLFGQYSVMLLPLVPRSGQPVGTLPGEFVGLAVYWFIAHVTIWLWAVWLLGRAGVTDSFRRVALLVLLPWCCFAVTVLILGIGLLLWSALFEDAGLFLGCVPFGLLLLVFSVYVARAICVGVAKASPAWRNRTPVSQDKSIAERQEE